MTANKIIVTLCIMWALVCAITNLIAYHAGKDIRADEIKANLCGANIVLACSNYEEKTLYKTIDMICEEREIDKIVYPKNEDLFFKRTKEWIFKNETDIN